MAQGRSGEAGSAPQLAVDEVAMRPAASPVGTQGATKSATQPGLWRERAKPQHGADHAKSRPP